MDISLIVNLGLPVLVVTGSLHHIIANAGLGKKSVVLFFVLAAALSLLPDIRIAGSVWLCTAGLWFCVAPAVYLVLKRAYAFRFFIVFSLSALFGILFAFVEGAYAVPYMSAAAGGLIVLTALIGGGRKAAVYAPVLVGVFFVVRSTAAATAGISQNMVLFADIGMAALSTAACLFAAYLIYRPRGRHEKRRRFGHTHVAVHSGKD